MPAVDNFARFSEGMGTPVSNAEVVVPDNATEQTFVCRALYVGVAGNVTVLMESGVVVTFTALPIGIHPIRAKRVNATGTTATSMLFLE
jgi:hypothetical protein